MNGTPVTVRCYAYVKQPSSKVSPRKVVLCADVKLEMFEERKKIGLNWSMHLTKTMPLKRNSLLISYCVHVHSHEWQRDCSRSSQNKEVWVGRLPVMINRQWKSPGGDSHQHSHLDVSSPRLFLILFQDMHLPVTPVLRCPNNIW